MKRHLIIISTIGIWTSSFAQGTGNESYDEMLKMNDTEFYKPTGFHELTIEKIDTLAINPNYVPKYGWPYRNIGWTYPFGLESDASDCVFLYPTVFPNMIQVSNVIEDELQAFRADSDLDISRLITRYSTSGYTANADSIFVYDFELKVPYRGVYTHVIGICLRKYAHGSLLMKMLLNDSGMAKKDKYLSQLINSVKYGNTTLNLAIEEEQQIKESGDYFFKPRQKNVWVKPKEGYIN